MHKLLTPAIALAVFAASGTALAQPHIQRFELPPTAQVDGLHVVELSGLGWDADDAKLYAISDRGDLFQFQLERSEGSLKVLPLHARALTDETGGAASFNAEGMSLENGNNGKSGDSTFILSLEGSAPAIARFDHQGRLQARLQVPAPVNDANLFRKKGRGLESVAQHPDFGIMTAPESPLKSAPQQLHTIYAEGRQWTFPRHADNSRLKEFLVLPDGSLLVLERTKGASKSELSASLSRVSLKDCGANKPCEVETWVNMPAGVDNFEGMAMLDSKHVLLVSDNGGDVATSTAFALVTLP